MYTQVASNKRKTIILMAGFVALVWLIAWVMSKAWNSPGMVGVLIILAATYALISYYASAKVALALSGAKPVTKQQAPELFKVVENLAITSGLPTPSVYIIDDAAPNAFATGRDPQHAAVAVTSGLLAMMNKTELEGVLAHELSHVGNYDIRVMAIVIMLVSIVSIISHIFLRMTFFSGDDDNNDSNGIFMVIGLALALISPIIASLVQLAVSRKREYLADASGALLTRYPEGLESALAKISADQHQLKRASTATAHLFIVNPLKGKGAGAWIANLFSTHPPIDDRIAKLKQMESNV